MDSVIKFKPIADGGGQCIPGKEYSRVLCRGVGDGDIGNPGNCRYTTANIKPDNTLEYTGVAASMATSTDDVANAPKVLLFITTVTDEGGESFEQPDGVTNGLKLSTSLEVSSSGTTGTFVMDFTGLVDGSGAHCEIDSPNVSFR